MTSWLAWFESTPAGSASVVEAMLIVPWLAEKQSAEMSAVAVVVHDLCRSGSHSLRMRAAAGNGVPLALQHHRPRPGAERQRQQRMIVAM